MKLTDLYYRVLGTTGLDVMDLTSLRSAVSNCMADLTSRGYKLLREMTLTDFEIMVDKQNLVREEKDKLKIEVHDGLLILPAPNDIRKSVYLRVFFREDADVATRMSLSDPRVQCKYINGVFRGLLKPNETIYYIKNDKLYIEWHTQNREQLQEFCFAYYQKLTCPDTFPIDPKDVNKMDEVDIPIRKEFEDALVLYAAYFYTARFLKDSDKIQYTLNNYKYYVEDIIHELSYEDEFNEEDAVIKIEEDY